jgi:hypothetical protein
MTHDRSKFMRIVDALTDSELIKLKNDFFKCGNLAGLIVNTAFHVTANLSGRSPRRTGSIYSKTVIRSSPSHYRCMSRPNSRSSHGIQIYV